MNHDKVSFIKSALRILAALVILSLGINWTVGWFVVIGLLLMLAEILGIIEELV